MIHIFSQGDIKDFKMYENSRTMFHLNESIEETFMFMVDADVLLTAPSSFSYTAGILSDGVVYYIPFWHKKLPNWINMEQDRYIIDVGSSWNGHVTKKWKEDNKSSDPIIFIEPDKWAFDKLRGDTPDIKLNIAVALEDGHVEFNYYQEGTHSILKTNVDEVHKFIDGYTNMPAKKESWIANKVEKVPCKRLDTLVKEYNIKYIPFLKIDTQGYDLNVIKSLGEYLNIVDELVCEVQITDFELYLGGSKKDEIVKYMLKNNFKLVKEEKQTIDQEENLYFKRYV
jgi:FkbM family methyltransferase